MKIEATSFRVKVALIIIYGTAGKNVIRSALRKYTPKNALPNVAENLFGKNSNSFSVIITSVSKHVSYRIN